MTDVAAPGGDLDELIELFFAARRSAKQSPHTTAAYRRDLAGITAHLPDVVGIERDLLRGAVLDATAMREAFGRFADTHANASVARCWSTWNQFFIHLVADGVISGNPMPAVRAPSRPRQAPKPLLARDNVDDTPEILLRSASQPRDNARDPWPEREVAVIAMLLLTGLRSAELLSLTLGSIVGRPEERRVQVTGKGGKARSVPMEEPLHALIQTYLASRRHRFRSGRIGVKAPLFVDLRGDPLRRGGLQYLVKSAMRAAAVNDLRSPGALVHALRHTYATRLAEDGASASEIMKLLGHGSLVTSQAYIDATANERREAAKANRTYRVLKELTGERTTTAIAQ